MQASAYRVEIQDQARQEADGRPGVWFILNSTMKHLSVFVLLAVTGAAGELKLGKPLQLPQPTPLAQLAAQPDKYAGKIVHVQGKVTEVCQMMGCWMQLVDPGSGKAVRIKVNDGEIVFPKDAVGKMATAEGKFTRIALTKEQALAQAKHEAEERGRPFDPAKAIGPAVFYQVQGTGAVLEAP